MKNCRTLFVSNLIILLSVLIIPLMGSFADSASLNTIKIGSATNFSDRLGIQVKRILEMEAALVNEKGGLNIQGQRYNIEMIVYDHKYTADGGRAAGERLVFQDKVKFIVNPYGIAPCLAMLEVAEPNKIPFFHGAAGVKLLDPKFKYAVHTKALDGSVYPEWSYVKEHLLAPTVKTVVMCTYDDATGHIMADMMEKAWANAGIETVGRLYFKRGQTDFAPIATKLRSLNPDMLNLTGVMAGADILLPIKAAYNAGWKGQIAAEYAKDTVPKVAEEIGKEAVEGLVCDYYDPSEIPNPPPLAVPFRNAYTKRYGVWETDGLQFATGWWFLMEAIKKANSFDPDAVMAACKELEVNWPGGHAKLIKRPDVGNERYCDTVQELYVGQVKDGKVVFFGKIGLDDVIRRLEKWCKCSVK